MRRLLALVLLLFVILIPTGLVRADNFDSQPDGTGGKDTYISKIYPSNNYGAASAIVIGMVGDNPYKGLLQFDLSTIPSNAVISSATITLYCTTETDAIDINISLYRSLVDWYEGSEDGATPTGDGSVWDYENYNGSVTWTVSGGLSGADYSNSASDTQSVTACAGTSYQWNVMDDVQNIVNGTNPNYGWWLIDESSSASDSRKYFVSSDHPSAYDRPKINIVYSLATSTPTVTVTETGSPTLTVTPTETVTPTVASPASTSTPIPSSNISKNIVLSSGNEFQLERVISFGDIAVVTALGITWVTMILGMAVMIAKGFVK